MSTAVEEMNIEAILAIMNTAELVIEIKPEKIQARTRYCSSLFLIFFQLNPV